MSCGKFSNKSWEHSDLQEGGGGRATRKVSRFVARAEAGGGSAGGVGRVGKWGLGAGDTPLKKIVHNRSNHSKQLFLKRNPGMRRADHSRLTKGIGHLVHDHVYGAEGRPGSTV
jgi:hypothetical protein